MSFLRTIVFLLLAARSFAAQAQEAPRTFKVAVFAPLYLDSSFDANGTYKGDARSFPRYSISGLEFAEGARLAFDTLAAQGNAVQAWMYDTKAADEPLGKLIADHRLDSVQLLIGHVNGNDYQLLAAFAQEKHIPFISATFPNDGGITANPYTVLLNSTLYTHCQGIYQFILKNHPVHQLFYIRRSGPADDLLARYFKQLNDNNGKPLLNIQTIEVGDTVNTTLLQEKLDSNRHSVIIAGSLDETFGVSIAHACGNLMTSYPMTLIGMPTWEGTREFQSPELRAIPYLGTATFVLPDIDSTTAPSLPARYTSLTKGRPSDMVFRGYESTYLFTSLLIKFGEGMTSHLNDRYYQTYSTFDIRPVFTNKESKTPDYFENKHIYILRRQNGGLMRMN